MRSIISISLSGLENIGLRKILESIPMIKLECINVSGIKHIDPEKYDLLITNANTAIKNLNIFLPVKGKTIVVTDVTDAVDSAFVCMNSNSSQEDIIQLITNTLENSIGKNEVSNKLSGREIEVLVELASGKTQKEIADKLCISLTTVISHRKNISTKLGIRSISGLALYAALNGYIKN